MKLPTIPDRGITKRGRKFIQECLDYMRATTPVAGAGTSVRELAGGTQINANSDESRRGTLRCRIIVGGIATDADFQAVVVPEPDA